MKKLILLFILLYALSGFLIRQRQSTRSSSRVSIWRRCRQRWPPVNCSDLFCQKADKVTAAEICNSAVRAVLFKGWVDKSKSSSFDSSVNHPAIAGNPDVEIQHTDYFNDFFISGEAAKYVDIVEDTRKVTKSGKVYLVSQTVSVNVPALRSKLERDNIIKSLKSGW